MSKRKGKGHRRSNGSARKLTPGEVAQLNLSSTPPEIPADAKVRGPFFGLQPDSSGGWALRWFMMFGDVQVPISADDARTIELQRLNDARLVMAQGSKAPAVVPGSPLLFGANNMPLRQP